MAPNGLEALDHHQRPRRSSTENGLQRALSDLSLQIQLSKDHAGAITTALLSPISEVAEVDAKCECCGMSEACTPDYVRRVRAGFAGKWICGLCSEAVKEEATKNGGRRREALDSHVRACERFNGIGRTHPALFQADDVRTILRKARPPVQHRVRDGGGRMGAGIGRSSSCIPAISNDDISNFGSAAKY